MIELRPPGVAVRVAIEQSLRSTCTSKRGVVIFEQYDGGRGGRILSQGYNGVPDGITCVKNGTKCEGCAVRAIHAEMRALLAYSVDPTNPPQAPVEMLHVKTIDGQLVPSGLPSCYACAKHIAVSGIAFFWLYHAYGWRRYSIRGFLAASWLNDPNTPSAEKG